MTSGVYMNGFPGFCSPAMNYLSGVSCLDTIADVTGSYPMPMGGGLYGPSLFGAGGCMPFGAGCMPFGAGTMGYCGGPGYETMNMTMKDYLGYSHSIENDQIERSVDMYSRMDNANYRASTYNNVVAERIAILNRLIKENNQDQVPAAYSALVEAVKDKIKHDSGNDKLEPNPYQAEALAKKYYAQTMQGRNIGDDLEEYGDSPFWHGAKKAAGLGLGYLLMDSRSGSENIADIEGTKIPHSEKAKEYLGIVASGILSVIAAVLLFKGGKALLKTKPVNTVVK